MMTYRHVSRWGTCTPSPALVRGLPRDRMRMIVLLTKGVRKEAVADGSLPSAAAPGKPPPPPPPLIVPAAAAAAAAVGAAPFLAGLAAGDAAAGLWLLQQGEARRLVLGAPAVRGCDAGEVSIHAAQWRRDSDGAHAGTAPPQPTAGLPARAVPDASASSADAAGPAGTGTQPDAAVADPAAAERGSRQAAPRRMACRWRVQLRDCVDAAPAVVATTAALAGDPRGDSICS